MKKPSLPRGILCLLFSISFLVNNSKAQTYIGMASSHTNNTAQAGPTVTITPVTGLQAGDLVVMYAVYEGTTQTLTISNAGGQTWISETQSNSTNQRTKIFWCQYNGTWSANPSVTVTTGTSSLSATMYAYRPTVSTNKWFLNTGPNHANVTNTAVNITEVVTTGPNSVTMAFWATPSANTWSGTLASGWIKPGASAQYINTTSGQSHTSAYKIMSSAGGTGDVSQSQSSSVEARTSILSWTELPNNDDCTNAVTLTPTGVCSPTAGSLYNAAISNPTGTSCTGRYDVWYKFTLPSNPEATYATITVVFTSATSSLTNTNTFVELFNASSCPVSTPIGGCTNLTSPRTFENLTPGSTYYFRVNTSATPSSNPTRWNFNVCVTTFKPDPVGSGRMNEVFRQTVLSPAGVLADPWEITYGADNKLWITESKGYKVYRMDPNTGVKTMVLDISDGSTFLGPDTANIRSRSNNAANAQGGLAGLALHPRFMDGTAGEKNYVYISYVFQQASTATYPGKSNPCRFFINKIVRFTYDKVNNKLGSPLAICDTLPGSNDHNSQRMIIAPVGSTYYLFYGSGDMGAGQFDCRDRAMNAQSIHSYEGKILRFNVDSDNDTPTESDLTNWIPNNNPYNVILGKQSAVWSTGIRNNQGFAYDPIVDKLYGSSHGPYSDDEINIIEPFRNYGHPIVIGYASDGNYNGQTVAGGRIAISAGTQYNDNTGISSAPPIGDEMANVATIDGQGRGLYKDPLFSAYATPAGDTTTQGTIRYIWRFGINNGTPPGWRSEAWSGLDLYTGSSIPGWKKSLIAASLKWGRLVRIKLAPSGTITLPSNDPINNAGDTISYFGSQNRFRDLAFDPNGKDIYVVMDRSTTTSGPSAANPVVPACQGCVQKYTFLGYNVNSGSNNRSYIPASIPIAQGVDNTCDSVNAVTINSTNGNNNIWVPLTDTSGNIVAEIYAMGQNLGRVTASLYHNANAIRSRAGKKYLDRNITITPEFQPSGNVMVRLYITEAEYLALQGAIGSAVSTYTDVKLYKNDDVCSAAMTLAPTAVTMSFDAEPFGSGGYVLQGTISSFSTFYFGSGSLTTLPLSLVSFTGSLQANKTTLLKWNTTNEVNTARFEVERSVDGNTFTTIGSVISKNQPSATYQFADPQATNQQSQVLYYRLKMVDIDGKYTYSNIVVINLSTPLAKVTIAPNPVHDRMSVTISSPVAGKAIWKITDNTGRVLIQSSSDLKVGTNNLDIYTSTLSGGIYYLTVSGTGIDQKQKFQKL